MAGNGSVRRPTIAVLIKHVALASDSHSPVDAPRELDPINEVALEWALRQRANGRASTVVAVAMGPPDAAEVLRRAVAFGVDDTLLATDQRLIGSDVRQTARVLSAAVDYAEATVAVFGYESLDSSSGAVPSAVASVLGWPVLTRASDARWNDDDTLDVDRDVGSGPQRMRVGLPAALSFVEGRIEPRYPVLRDVLRSRRAVVTEVDLDRLGVAAVDSPRNERVVHTEPLPPPERDTTYAEEHDGPDAILDILAKLGYAR